MWRSLENECLFHVDDNDNTIDNHNRDYKVFYYFSRIYKYDNFDNNNHFQNYTIIYNCNHIYNYNNFFNTHYNYFY